MLMKLFNKGQVVIPAAMRHRLGIAPGDFVDVAVDYQNRKIELRPSPRLSTASPAGSLANYSRSKPFPTRKQVSHALEKGLVDDE